MIAHLGTVQQLVRDCLMHRSSPKPVSRLSRTPGAPMDFPLSSMGEADEPTPKHCKIVRVIKRAAAGFHGL
jgi:hypothetical protein